MQKRITLALLPILAVVLTACTLADLPVIGRFFGGSSGGETTITGDPVAITFWGLWENPSVINALIAKYQEQHPNVTINYDDRSVLDPLEYKERAFTRATEETGPDIMRVHVSWVPRLRGSLTTVPTNLITPEAFNTTYYPVASQNMVFDGKVYGYPAYYDGLVLVYNLDHFAEVGQQSAPTAWEEFRRLAIELTVEGDRNTITRAGAAIGAADNIDFFSDILGLLFSQASVSMPDGIDGRPAQDALTFYTNFVTEDKVWSPSFPEATTAFVQGNVSMMFVPTWILLDILQNNPELNIGVAPVPQALPDNPASWASFWVDVVPQSSKNQAVAWDFLNFMNQEEQQLLLFSEASRVRPFGAPYSRVSLSSELASNPYIKPALDTASIAKTYEIAARAGNRRQVDALKAAVNSLLSGGSAEEALKAAKAEIAR